MTINEMPVDIGTAELRAWAPTQDASAMSLELGEALVCLIVSIVVRFVV